MARVWPTATDASLRGVQLKVSVHWRQCRGLLDEHGRVELLAVMNTKLPTFGNAIAIRPVKPARASGTSD